MESQSLNIDWDNIPNPFAIDVYRNDKFSDVTKESILIGGDIVEQITKPKLSQLVHISWTIYCNVGIDMKINLKCMHICNNVVAWR